MPLHIPSEWVFDGSGVEMPKEFHWEATKLISKIAGQTSNPKWVYEQIKIAFDVHHNSTNLSFAESDCIDAMRSKMDDAASYLKSLYDGIEAVSSHATIPDDLDGHLNKLLLANNAPVGIRDYGVELVDGDAVIYDDEEDEPLEERMRYTLGEQIGYGGFGDVFRASRNTSISSFEYALKFLNPKFSDNPEKALLRFQEEMKVLSRLRHRGVVSYFDAGKDSNGRSYIVMELIEGQDLRTYLSGKSSKEVRRVFIEITKALEYVHSNEVLHRDIKPSNIIVRNSDKQPIILDFGCAFYGDDGHRMTITSKEVGSYAYIPPEVIANPKLRSEKQDVFACGVVLYEVIAQCLPNRDSLESLKAIGSKFSVFDDIVRDAIAPVKARIPNAREFLKRLRALSL